jgi:3',5'-cyclic AMP phosphodiesterase CpdA
MSMLLAHFSDVHVSSHWLGWRLSDYFNKRLTGWANLRFLGRGKHFHGAAGVLTSLMADVEDHKPAHLIFSGDATGLGFDNELVTVARILCVGDPARPPGLAVPGNHDYYTTELAASGSFERYFDPWQQGERIEGHRYPFAQKAGRFWLIAVNSSTPNRGIVDASGAVGHDQLGRLETLLSRLSPKPRILVTHYPICLANGLPEKRMHGLRDLPQLLDALRGRGICLWLHGHRHHAYRLQHPPVANFPVICSGSATQHGCASYGLYEIAGHLLRGRCRRFNPLRKAFEDGDQFELNLPC